MIFLVVKICHTFLLDLIDNKINLDLLSVTLFHSLSIGLEKKTHEQIDRSLKCLKCAFYHNARFSF